MLRPGEFTGDEAPELRQAEGFVQCADVDLEGLAQEVVQELFLKLARDADAVTTARSERAVIFTIARNLSLDVLRRRQREERALEAWEQELPCWFEPAADQEADWCG